MSSRLLKIVPALALAAAASLVAGHASAATEVAPLISMNGNGLSVSHSSNGAQVFGCFPNQAPDGTFTCGSNISGQIVGISQGGVIIGHRIHMTRVVSAIETDTYDGAIEAQTGNGLPPVWMAGERSTTITTRSCIGRTCTNLSMSTGPRPWTGYTFFIGG